MHIQEKYIYMHNKHDYAVPALAIMHHQVAVVKEDYWSLVMHWSTTLLIGTLLYGGKVCIQIHQIYKQKFCSLCIFKSKFLQAVFY